MVFLFFMEVIKLLLVENSKYYNHYLDTVMMVTHDFLMLL
jgi:hypothetical protein